MYVGGLISVWLETACYGMLNLKTGLIDHLCTMVWNCYRLVQNVNDFVLKVKLNDIRGRGLQGPQLLHHVGCKPGHLQALGVRNHANLH